MNVFCFCGDSDIVLGQCVQTIVDLNHDLPITKLDNKPKTFMFGTVYRNRQLWNPMMIYPKNTHKNQKNADLPYWNRQWGPHPPQKKKNWQKTYISILHLTGSRGQEADTQICQNFAEIRYIVERQQERRKKYIDQFSTWIPLLLSISGTGK